MQINKIILILLLIIGFASCQPKEKYDWEVGLSAPKYYSSSPSVRFFYKGKSVGSASANIGIQPGWVETAGGYASGKEEDEIPDSLHVEWLCGTDRYYYKGDFVLPRKKMIKFFQNPITNLNGLSREYSLIIVGTAPGGNVTVWLGAGSILTEIAKFKAENTGIWKENDKDYDKYWGNIDDNIKYKNKDFNVYHYLHGIDYKVWEKGEKEYNYDVGFTSQDGNIKMSLLTFFSKAGTVFQPDTYSETPFTIDKSQWSKVSYQVNNNIIKKEPLPIMMRVEILDKKHTNLYFSTDVVLPLDFKKKYLTTYLDTVTNKKENYNRIVIGIYSDYTKGIIWLEGKNKRIKLMGFKNFIRNKEQENNYQSGGYSLPKNFEFPKWEGREKLIKPDLEFWQEE
ncbi:DUF2931 family protein [Flavobacterium psychrophilum]|nr:DUF2931 family protein [Flavobacterium psychrophilum]